MVENGKTSPFKSNAYLILGLEQVVLLYFSTGSQWINVKNIKEDTYRYYSEWFLGRSQEIVLTAAAPFHIDFSWYLLSTQAILLHSLYFSIFREDNMEFLLVSAGGNCIFPSVFL